MKVGNLVRPRYGHRPALGIVTDVDYDSLYCSVCWSCDGSPGRCLCIQLEIINES